MTGESPLTQNSGHYRDTGLDIIAGHLDEQPTIWQCKHFLSIKDSQKRQIKSSLNEALKHYTPKRWFLCIPIDMNASTMRWFQRLTTSRSDRTEVKLYAANDIVRELHYRHAIREAFFPTVSINIPELRELLTKTSDLNDAQLKELTTSNAQTYLARLEKADARFTYEITIGRNRGQTNHHRGEILTINSGENVVRVYPRDAEALKQTPIGATIMLKGTGVEKFLDVHRTARAHKFNSEEIVSFTSDLDHLLPIQREGMALQITPQPPNHTIPLRVIYGTGNQADTYECILFQGTRGGTEEVELQSKTQLPFRVTLTMRKRDGIVTFADRSQGQELEPTIRQVRAIINAIRTGSITFYNLETNKVLARAKLNGPVPEWVARDEEFLAALQTIAQSYGVHLRVPTAVTEKDLESMEFLTKLLVGLDFSGAESEVELVQIDAPDTSLREMLTKDVSLRIEKPTLPDEPILFGIPVPTGPIGYSVPKARFNDPQAIFKFLDTAPLGATMFATLLCDGPIHLERLTEPEVAGK